MQLPNNSEAFKSIVVGKIRTYCDANIWPFEYERFTSWLANFDCKIEEYVVLQILDSLIVRSNDMAKTSYSRLLSCDVRQHLISHAFIKSLSIEKWKRHLLNGSLNNVMRFSPVRQKSDEGESGSVIYRLMSEELDTNKYSYAAAAKPIKVVILVDDFVGSGDQFKDFANEFELEEKLKNTHVIYCPLIGFECGISEIKESFPKLHILPGEIVRKDNSIFYGEDNALFKNDQKNTVKDIKLFWENMKIKYAPNMPNWFGYKEAALPIAFQWGCPNQTPALLYLNHSIAVNNWKRLFSRRS